MQRLIQAFREFKALDGISILFSTIVGKGLNFLLSFLIIKILSAESYGQAIYSLNIVSFAMPFIGLGAYQGILRFGALSSSQQGKRKLFFYGLKKGLTYSLYIILLMWGLSFYFETQVEKSGMLIRLIAFQILSYTLFEAIKSYVRINYMNKTFARMDLTLFCIQFVLGIGLGYLFGGQGYLLALVVSPAIAGIYFYFKLNLDKNRNAKNSNTEFWKYSVNTSLGNIAAQVLFLIDILLIGQILLEETAKQIAYYRAATLIPFNLSFVAYAYIHTTFVKVSKNSNDKKALLHYIKNYYILFIPFTLISIVLLLLTGESIFNFLKPDYQKSVPIFNLLCVGVLGNILFRIPFGNLLSAIGKAHWNTVVAFSILAINLVANYFAIEYYGIIGAAYTTACLLWISGIVNAGLFFIWISKQK